MVSGAARAKPLRRGDIDAKPVDVAESVDEPLGERREHHGRGRAGAGTKQRASDNVG
jgi:hypothetical protein